MLIAAALLSSGVTQELLGVPGLSLAILAGCLAFEFEIISQRSNARQQRITASWPIVLESLESAAVAGMSLLESLRDLSESEQLYVSREFTAVCDALDSGIGFDDALTELKQRLANPAADFTVELLRITNALGSAGYVIALRNQATNMRQESTLVSELEAKQGWVVGTAKLAVTAPWLIVIILCLRAENAQLYRSILGTTILFLGLLASAVALRLVYRIGSINAHSRVFA
jgi:tight adherence protein B